MLPRQRTIAYLAIPLLTLAFGWQLGAQYTQRIYSDSMAQWEQRMNPLSASGAVITDPEKEVDLSLFWEVWRLLGNHYIEPEGLKPNEMLFGAVSGLVESVGDPYTVFMPPEDNKEFRQSLNGQLQGIGAELALRNKEVIIVAPIKGSPAQRAGLLPEDIIIQVDDKTLENLSLTEVVQRIRGDRGTKVKLTILREGNTDPLESTLTREDIKVPSTEYEMKKTPEGDIGYLSINQFGQDTVIDARRAIEELKQQPMKGFIVDLRFNGGGYLEGAVELSSLFVPQGKIVTVERKGQEPQRHYASGKPLLPETPMVVLINQGSASASEIFAGAMRDLDRATIIGMKSFGKGTVQEVIDLPGGSSLRVTVAKWLTPDGTDLGKHGIKPDYYVDRVEADYDAERDPQLATGGVQ